MTCFLELEDGTGALRLEDATGNLLLEFCNDQQASNWYPTHDVERRNREYQHRLDEQRREVIELKLAAQDLYIERKELDGHRDKQSLRQLKSLQRQEIELKKQIDRQLMILAELQTRADQQFIQDQNMLAIVLLQMAYPYLNLMAGGSSMN